MKHYHLFFILCCSFVCLCANAQPNERLQELEQNLQRLGFGVTHIQRSSRGIEQRWTSHLHLSLDQPRLTPGQWAKWSNDEQKDFLRRNDSIRALQKQRTDEAIDLIRSSLSSLAGEASESYMYEVHNRECDTVRLAMAWRDGNLALNSWRGDGGVHYTGSREAVYFNYQRSPGQEWASGMYTHLFTDPYPEPMGDIKSFDGEAFKAIIEPCLKRALRLKGAKRYPIYWRHDEGYEQSVGDDLIFKVTHQSDYGDNKHTGLTTGDLYFIPKTLESEAEELLSTLDSLAYDFTIPHYDQDYTYHFNPRFTCGNVSPIVSGSNWPDKQPVQTEYGLSAYLDEDGFYFLVITTKGELWMPRNFANLKSWINGERVPLKR